MKLLKSILIAIALGTLSWGQTTFITPGNINTSGADCSTASNCVILQFSASNPSQGSASLWLTGTWSGTMQFEVTSDVVPNNATTAQLNALTWVSVSAFPSSSTTGATNTTANGLWVLNAANITAIRVRASALASGSANVTIRGSTASASKGGGGGGGGTLTPLTVATLPAGLGAGGTGTLETVKDGTNASDCVTGLSTFAVTCIWTGAAWAFAGSAAAAPAFSAITAGTNTAALVVGTGGTLSTTSTGTINANLVNSGTVPATAPLLGTNGSKQPISVTTVPTSTFPALTGDVTTPGASLATTVVAINGGAVPATAKVLGSNGSSQPIATALTSAHIFVGSAGNVPADVALSGDSSITNAGVMTNTKLNNGAVPASATILGSNGSSQPIAAALTATDIYVGSAGNLPVGVAVSGDSTITSAGVMTNTAINGTAFPTSASVVGSNGSAQPVIDTAHNVSAPAVCTAPTGTGTAQTCSTSPTFVAANPDCVYFTAGTTNTGDVTLAVNGGSASHIYKWQGASVLAAGDLQAGITQLVCLDTNATPRWEMPTVGNPPASGATINAQNQFGAPYYSVSGSSNTLSGIAPPSTLGIFNNGWINPSAAATAPQVQQVGLSVRTLSGATTTCGTQIIWSDVDSWIVHDIAASGTVNCTLPTPTALANTAFAVRYSNRSAQTDTITPTTFTIQKGTFAAGASITVASGEACVMTIDPFNATNWLADCGSNSGLTASGTLPTASSQGQLPAANGAGTVYSAQTKQLTDTRDDPSAGANVCIRLNDQNGTSGTNLTGSNVQIVSAEGERSASKNECGATDIAAFANEDVFNGSFNLHSDTGIHVESWQQLIGENADVVGVRATSNLSGSVIQATSSFPSTSALTVTGTSTQSHITFIAGAGEGLPLLSPGTRFRLDQPTTATWASSDAGTTVTLTTTGGNWGTSYTNPTSITVSNCSAGTPAGGANGTYTILSGGGATTALKITNTTTGSGSSCFVVLTNGDGNTDEGGMYTVLKCAGTGAPCANADITTGGSTLNSEMYTLPASGSISVNITPALASSPSAAAFSLFQPLTTLGNRSAQNTGQVGIANDWSRIQGFLIDGANQGNGYCNGGLSVFAQENSGYIDTSLPSCGLGLVLYNPVDAGPYKNLNIGYSSDKNCTVPTVPLEIDGIGTEIDRVTVNGNNCNHNKYTLGEVHITNYPALTAGFSGALHIHNLHFEGSGDGTFGGSTCTTCTADGIFMETGQSGGQQLEGPVSLSEIIGAPSAFPVTNMVHIASTFAGTLNYTNSAANSGSVNFLKDDLDNSTYTRANNPNGLGFAFLDGSGAHGGLFTNLNSADAKNAIDIYSGTLGFYGGTAGTALASINTAGNGVFNNITVNGTCTGCGSGSGDTITSPNSTLTVGGTSTATTLDINLTNPNTWSGMQVFSANGAASTAGMSVTGTPFTGGSGTTTKPQFYVTSGTAPTGFSTAGTLIGANGPSGFTGNIFDSFINGGSNNAFTVSYGGGATNFINLNARAAFSGNFLNFATNGGSSVFAVSSIGNVSISQTAASQFALNLTNTTAATSSVAQSSPFDIRTGQFWASYFPSTGSPSTPNATTADCWSHQVQETNGTNGSSIYTMLHNAAADGCQGTPASSYMQAPFNASWGVQTNTLSQPSTPVITHAGTTGAATWTYTVVAAVGPTFTQASAAGSTTTGNTTLCTPPSCASGIYNIITWSVTPNADYYLVYRTVSGGTPATLGIIAAVPSGSTATDASCSASTCVVNDKGAVGDTTSAQAYNSTGQVYVGTGPAVGGGTGGGMFSTVGTVPTTIAGTAVGWYGNSANSCFDINNEGTDLGCAIGVATAQTISGAKTFSGGIINTTTPIRDQTRFVLASNMTAVATAGVNIGSTGAGNSTFSWPVTAANWYDLSCHLPVTFAATATIKFQLVSISGSVTISNVNSETMGNTGAAAVFQDLATIAGTTLATSATPVTGAPGASEAISYNSQFLTSHAGNIGLEFIANGTNNVTMLLGGECGITQIN